MLAKSVVDVLSEPFFGGHFSRDVIIINGKCFLRGQNAKFGFSCRTNTSILKRKIEKKNTFALTDYELQLSFVVSCLRLV